MTPSWDVLSRLRSYTSIMKALRALLAVSHPLARQLIAEGITKVRGVQLVGKMGSGWEVIPLATQLKPDVVIVDFRLPI